MEKAEEDPLTTTATATSTRNESGTVETAPPSNPTATTETPAEATGTGEKESDETAAPAASSKQGTDTATATSSNTKKLPPANAVEKARKQVNDMIEKKELDANDSSSLQALFRENEAMKEKVSKLKALLGRSAKAQRESKVELDATTKRLDAVGRENERLKAKIEKLSSRPTHMELLADFETNFDRALLSVGQSGGQDTAGTAPESAGASVVATASSPRSNKVFDFSTSSDQQGAVVDSLLMQELSDAKQRVDKLEKLNSALVHRSSQLEGDLKEAKRSMDELLSKLSHVELEKRMAVMEAENATKAMQEKSASLAEMQMEIDMVTKSAQKAALRAAAGEEMIKTVKSDKMQVQQLEEKAKALQEWAIASNQAKTLAQERMRLLEAQLRRYQKPATTGLDGSNHSGHHRSALIESTEEGRILFSKKGSLVVGAGDINVRVFELSADVAKTINPLTQRVVLRWTFDTTHEDADISFSILKGSCESVSDRNMADALIKDRLVKGGAGGETENAFAIGRACTLVWCNSKSWVRPRTVKYSVDAVVLSD